ncbi:hypothetical protein FALBO_13469 [Fusarium albosuccineum]|uniref:Uncharacterized protein n=1 Tax=Fusarium albosuccineum TaxID=1237068 RepID=A0A8H4PGC7_9HYPO|nr:hypothetical protein FALBO_13469 [Fusarium albosuccineum]
MSSSYPLYRPSLKMEARAAFAQLTRPEQRARAISQLDLCRATLEQTLFVLPPNDRLAKKMQDVINEIRRQVLQSLPMQDADNDNADLEQNQPRPSIENDDDDFFACSPISPPSPELTNNSGGTPSGLDPIPFTLSNNNVGRGSGSGSASSSRHTNVNDSKHSDMMDVAPDTLGQRTELPLSPAYPTPNPLSVDLGSPYVRRRSNRKRERIDDGDLVTPVKRRPVFSYLTPS